MTLATILSRVTKQSSLTVAVAAAEDLETIEAVYEAVSREVSEFILFGNETTINELFRQYRPSLLTHKAVTVVHTESVFRSGSIGCAFSSARSSSYRNEREFIHIAYLKSCVK